MKNKNKPVYYILMAVLFLMYSCKKDSFLNVVPQNQLTDATVWQDSSTADVFLNDVYFSLPDIYNSFDPIENWTDNSICSFNWPPSRTVMADGLLSPTVDPTLSWAPPTQWYAWATLYNNIRKCNVFIQNVTASGSLTSTYKTTRLAEARFLRAYFYHIGWMFYGGMAIITVPDDRTTGGDSIFHARSSAADTYTFITGELASVANDLPVVPLVGRASKGAALTLKGWCELFNGKFTDAAATNKQVMDLGVYQLFSSYGDQFMPANNPEANGGNKEAIFWRPYLAVAGSGGGWDGYCGPTFTNDGVEFSWGSLSPTQELVDDYDMDNGLPITDPASGYDPQNPYVHRDPRFYQTIVYDGAKQWLGETYYSRQGVASPNEIDLTERSDGSNTGYAFRKSINLNNIAGLPNGQDYYIFRYAEVLLNYAEAQNEAAGPDATVYNAINLIRTRAGIPNLKTGLNSDQMRTAIRSERRVELCFEEKRWFDLIRWKLGANINTTLHGMLITPSSGGGLNYAPVEALGGQKQFDESKNYLFPIPTSVLQQNPKLTQNPNY